MTVTDLQRVMVASDSTDALEAALDKAARIEHYSGAEILVVQTCYHRIVDESPEVLPAEAHARLIEHLQAEAENALRDLVAPLSRRVASVDSRLIWTNDAAAAIAEEATRWRAQLLIKPVSRHHPVADFFHTPLDWTLMREAPCAVMVARGSSWDPGGPVLAAVDADDEDHDSLNREILQRAAGLARILGARLHVASAYPDLGRAVDQLQVGSEFENIEAEMEKRRRNRLTAWVTALNMEVPELHVLEGKPTDVIPALAESLGATVTVVGTAARHGVAKLVIGNTAEDLIGRLQGDLVTVRAPWS